MEWAWDEQHYLQKLEFSLALPQYLHNQIIRETNVMIILWDP